MRTLIAAAACALAPWANAQAAAPAAGLFTMVVVLDAPTARAVAASPYLRAFGAFDVRESVGSSEGHYLSMFLFGRQTTLEMFAPGDTDLDHPGADNAGMARLELMTDRAGALDTLKAALRDANVPLEDSTARRRLGEHEVDWFRALERAAVAPAQQGQPSFAVSLGEFMPAYFDVPEARKASSLGPDDRVSRARYNRREYDSARPLLDLAGATLAITREDWLSQRALLLADGYRIAERADGASAEGDVRVDVMFVPREHTGVRRIEFRIARARDAAHEERIGTSRLVVGPEAHAVWEFAPR